jgi:succinyl-diaminopimelate desuccinylase
MPILEIMSSATLELGPVNASIHKLNEHIESDDLDALKSIYRQVLERLLLPA